MTDKEMEKKECYTKVFVDKKGEMMLHINFHLFHLIDPEPGKNGWYQCRKCKIRLNEEAMRYVVVKHLNNRSAPPYSR